MRSRPAVRVAAALAAGGLVLLVACGLVARNGRVGPAERRVFHFVNDLPGWLEGPLWVFQQMGNIVVAFAILVVLALVLRSWRLGVAAAIAVAAKLALERVVKSVVERRRPGSTVADVVLRGDVSTHGLSFVSGHAGITTAAAMTLTAVLPGRWRYVPWVVVALNGIGRVYVGAHNPLDIVGGTGLGLIIGAPLYAWLASREAK
ncbi:MAG: phosphatase PAP2 family protein [Acidimicrobiales bacterium]